MSKAAMEAVKAFTTDDTLRSFHFYQYELDAMVPIIDRHFAGLVEAAEGFAKYPACHTERWEGAREHLRAELEKVR